MRVDAMEIFQIVEMHSWSAAPVEIGLRSSTRRLATAAALPALGLPLLSYGGTYSAVPLASAVAGGAQPDAPIELVQRTGARFGDRRVVTVRPGFRSRRIGVRTVRPVVVTRGWRRPGSY